MKVCNEKVNLWDLENSRLLWTGFQQGDYAIESHALTPDGNKVVIGGILIKCLDVPTGRCFRITKYPMNGCIALAVTHDSKRLGTGSVDTRPYGILRPVNISSP